METTVALLKRGGRRNMILGGEEAMWTEETNGMSFNAKVETRAAWEKGTEETTTCWDNLEAKKSAGKYLISFYMVFITFFMVLRFW